MKDNDSSIVPSELEYILQCCRAIAARRYEDALFLLKEGLRESVGKADQLDVVELITLMRTLVAEIEVRMDKDFGIKLRSLAATTELSCSFCGKSQSEVKKLVAGPSAAICNACVEVCSQTLTDTP